MRRILIINPFGVGDVVFSLVVVEAIKRACPDAFIGFLCNERTQELVRMDTSVDQVFVFNRDHFRSLWPARPVLFFRELFSLLSAVRRADFDAVFDLSLARQYSFFAMLAGIQKRIGFDYKGRGIFLTQKQKIKGYAGRHVADIQLGLLDLAGVPRGNVRARLPLRVPPAAREEARRLMEEAGFLKGDRVLAIVPGGGRSWGDNARFKQWDAERFAEAANRLSDRKRFKFVVIGDGTEKELMARTAAMLRHPALIAAGRPWAEVCALLQSCQALLCNDGGLLHLANALGVKTVSLFGPVDEKVYGPCGGDTPHEVLTQPVPCRPCYQNFHFPPCPYNRRCLDELPVDKVVAALEKMC